MGKGRREGSWWGWALGVLAAVTLVLAAPQHVLDFDEAGSSVAEAIVHSPGHTILDHGQAGHACAGHCAAHVMAAAPLTPVIARPSRRPLAWDAAQHSDAPSRPSGLPDRPPKA